MPLMIFEQSSTEPSAKPIVEPSGAAAPIIELPRPLSDEPTVESSGGLSAEMSSASLVVEQSHPVPSIIEPSGAELSIEPRKPLSDEPTVEQPSAKPGTELSSAEPIVELSSIELSSTELLSTVSQSLSRRAPSRA